MTELIKKVQAEIDNHEKVQSDFEYNGYRELIDYEPLKTLKALRVAIVALNKRDEWCNSLQGYDDGSDLSHEGKALFEIKEIMGVGE